MLLLLAQTTFTLSSSSSPSLLHSNFSNLNHPSTSLLPKTLFPHFEGGSASIFKTRLVNLRVRRSRNRTSTYASLLETPVLWAGRLCVYYALLKAGLAGSQSNPFVSGSFICFKLFFGSLLCFDCYLVLIFYLFF